MWVILTKYIFFTWGECSHFNSCPVDTLLNTVLNIAKANKKKTKINRQAFFLDYFYFVLHLLCSFTQLLDLAIVVNVGK